MEAESSQHAEQLKRALVAIRDLRRRLQEVQDRAHEPIAIVGMACRFPGAANIESYWDLLRRGVDAIRANPTERWDVAAVYDPEPDAPGKTYCSEGGFLAEVDGFDPAFFGISPREALSMDPQQRLLLEISWEALEHAGIPSAKLRGSRTGVFVGLSGTDYAERTVQSADPRRVDAYSGTGAAPSLASGRVAYVLGLHGPAVTVDTACSSSLVALTAAVEQLRLGKCDAALAGGVNLILSPRTTVCLSKIRALSPTNRCRTFDASADGYVRGEGCGILVLKRQSDAERDGDRILALIRGAATNHDGRSSGLTVPSGAAQEAVMRAALADAGLDADRVQYVEAHGTGTPLGDPIDMRAVAAVFATDPARRLLVGSVKTNIGHLESASGIAGVIKVVLALQHRAIPATLHFDNPSPHIAWNELAVRVPRELTPWPEAASPRAAGVSSYGFSGTNSHVIIEEAGPSTTPAAAETRELPLQVVTLSAASKPALAALASRHLAQLERAPNVSLADLAYTTNAGRSHFEHRWAAAFGSVSDLQRALRSLGAVQDGAAAVGPAGDAVKVAMVFTGQGSQYSQMGRELYDHSPVFRAAFDECEAIVQERTGESLKAVVYASAVDSTSINETRWTQPALFAVEYALAMLWRSWGVQPSVVLGHSLGEYVASCVAGLFDLGDALRLVVERAKLMQGTANGGMVVVRAPEDVVARLIAGWASTLAIAAVNGPENVVVSGAVAELDAFIASCVGKGLETQRLVVSHAFHSPLMDPLLPALRAAASGVRFAAPRIRIISNVTGKVAAAGELATPDYWAAHARKPVRFADSINAAVALGCTRVIEVGPHPTLLALAAGCIAGKTPLLLPSLRRGSSAWGQILESLAKLYTAGFNIDWDSFHSVHARRRIDLPTYPFQRERYWLERDEDVAAGAQAPAARASGKAAVGALAQREAIAPVRAQLEAASDVERPAQLLAYVRERVAHSLRLPEVERLDVRAPLANFGLDSLMAVELRKRVEADLGIELSLRTLLDSATVESVAAHAAAAMELPSGAALRGEFSTAGQIETTEPHPLAIAQERLWFVEQLQTEHAASNSAVVLRLRGALNEDALRAALSALVATRDALRTVFRVEHGVPVQLLAPFEVRLGKLSLKGLARDEVDAQLARTLDSEANTPFDAASGPLFRFTLLELEPQHHILALTFHHLVCDGWSVSLMLRDIALAYERAERGDSSPLLSPGPSFHLAAVRQRELAPPRIEQQLGYWMKRLSPLPEAADLPHDVPRSDAQTFAGAALPVRLGEQLSERITDCCRTNDTTPFVIFMAAYHVLLQRFTGSTTSVIGTPTANRHWAGSEDIVGLFMNPLPLLIRSEGDTTTRELLNRVRHDALDMLEHQDVPFDRLVRETGAGRSAGRMPLFQQMFIYQAFPVQGGRFAGLDAEIVVPEGRTTTLGLDVILQLWQQESRFVGTLEYRTDRFSAEFATDFVRHFVHVLTQMLERQDRPLREVEVLSSDDRAHALRLLSGEAVEATSGDELYGHLAAVAKRHRDRTAVVTVDPASGARSAVTYGGLFEQADRAFSSLKAAGLQGGDIVAIAARPSDRVLAVLLALWRAGVTPLPLDITQPLPRLQAIVADAAPTLVLCATLDHAVAALGPPAATFDMLEGGAIPARPRRSTAAASTPPSAYILYTSGTTGAPKGVVAEQSGLLNALLGWERVFALVPEDIHLQMASFGFDVFFGDLVRALGTGGRLVLCPREWLMDPAALVKLAREESVTCAEFVPAVLRVLADFLSARRARFVGVRLVPCGSDAWHPADYRRFRGVLEPSARLLNTYGVTEATVDSTYFEGDLGGESTDTLLPIGRPFPNVCCYVLDAYGQLCPPHAPGELYIGGDGVARGYFGQPELTASKFKPDPFSSDSKRRLYRTGDRARYRRDGTLELLGRLDDQVKVRGVRVELGEIEAVLSRFPGLQAVAVKLVTGASPDAAALAAYAVPTGASSVTAADLRAFVERHLPPALVPSSFTFLESLPLNANGKIDRKALPEVAQALAESIDRTPARTRTEAALVEIWTEILGLAQPCGVHADFFQLGGYSLLAPRLVWVISERLGAEIPVRSLYESPTIAGLATRIDAALLTATESTAGAAVSERLEF